jgi:hypothetical protein
MIMIMTIIITNSNVNDNETCDIIFNVFYINMYFMY